MLRSPLGGLANDDDDDFIDVNVQETYFTGSRKMHAEASRDQRSVGNLLPRSSKQLLPGLLAFGQLHPCAADVLALEQQRERDRERDRRGRRSRTEQTVAWTSLEGPARPSPRWP